ncbi:MAG: carboxypeptidase regulatory-like domain-containing protein [Gemmatimonadetes bacterium]|nr:carboxypeptidase regulatory-like domain-containing protein [Gemmatimonadota bacterium]
MAGIVIDAQGAPIAGAKIWVRPALTTGLLEATTDANGRYSVQGIATIPYRAYAWTFMNYAGKRLCLRLGSSVPRTTTLRADNRRGAQLQAAGRGRDRPELRLALWR